MREINYWAVMVAAIVAFILSTGWYIAFAKQRAALSTAMADVRQPQPAKMVLEIVRNIILAYVLAYLVARSGITAWPAAIKFAFLVWVGFPVLLLALSCGRVYPQSLQQYMRVTGF
jgi:NAD/NADP transhydrogenase beta subunit